MIAIDTKELLTPRGFLMAGGVVLTVLGLLGMVILGPTPEMSILGDFNWQDPTMNWIHLLLGVIALGAYYTVKDEKSMRMLVLLVGGLSAFAAVIGMLTAGSEVPNAVIANFEMSDNLLHALVAIWAFSASAGPSRRAAATSSSVKKSAKKSKKRR